MFGDGWTFGLTGVNMNWGTLGLRVNQLESWETWSNNHLDSKSLDVKVVGMDYVNMCRSLETWTS